MPLVVAVAAALSVLVLTVPDRYLTKHRRWLERQFARLGGHAHPGRPPSVIPALRLLERLPLGWLVGLADLAYGEKRRDWFRRHALYARTDESLTWNLFLTIKIAVALGCFLYLGLLLAKEGPDPVLVAVASSVPVFGFFIPDQWLFSRARRRQAQIERDLPAVLTTLAITTEAGLALAAAIDEVARTHRGPLGQDFRWTADQIRLGLPQGQALEKMAARSGVPALVAVMSSLVQSFEKGAAQVASAIRLQAQEAWAKRRRRAEEMAHTASVRLFMPLLLLVFPAVLIFLVGPAVMSLAEFFSPKAP